MTVRKAMPVSPRNRFTEEDEKPWMIHPTGKRKSFLARPSAMLETNFNKI